MIAASCAYSCPCVFGAGEKRGEEWRTDLGHICVNAPLILIFAGFLLLCICCFRSMMTIYYLTITMPLSGGPPGEKG